MLGGIRILAEYGWPEVCIVSPNFRFFSKGNVKLARTTTLRWASLVLGTLMVEGVTIL